jgi:hypothetical protein
MGWARHVAWMDEMKNSSSEEATWETYKDKMIILK